VGFEEGLERTIKWFVPKNAVHGLSGKNGKIRINLSDPNYAESPFPVTVFKHTNHKKQKASSR
jgi:hypothetical protein